MTEVRIAVPPGIGDCYFALSKLRSFRRRHDITRVHFLVQKSAYKRALDWSKMVDFVEQTSELKFKPNEALLTTGYAQGFPEKADHGFWPNAVIDRGEHLSRWLPEYDFDLDFEVKCDDPEPENRGLAVLYPSSVSINTVWLPQQGAGFWQELLGLIPQKLTTGVIGAFWDLPLSTQMRLAHVKDLVARTTLRQVAGIIRDARVVVGVISGMTILANHFKTPCVALCPDKFPPGFESSWVKPDAPYIVLRASEIRSARQVEDLALSIARSAIAREV